MIPNHLPDQGLVLGAADTPLVVGRTQDQALVRQVIGDHQLDAIVHFAAYKAAGESMRNPAKYFDNNVCGSLCLLQAAQQAGVRRFVFSSTAAVYGTPQSLPVQEDAPLRPENPYGESKLLVEQMLRWFDVCHGLRAVALRYFNAAGAALDASNGEDPRFVQNLIPLVMNAATGRAANVSVFGTDYPTPDGTGVRDYIHVLDLAAAHACALDFLAAHDRSEVFNLGTGQGASVFEVLREARRASGVNIVAENTARRPGIPPPCGRTTARRAPGSAGSRATACAKLSKPRGPGTRATRTASASLASQSLLLLDRDQLDVEHQHASRGTGALGRIAVGQLARDPEARLLSLDHQAARLRSSP